MKNAPAVQKTTIKARPATVARLNLLKQGCGLSSLDALLDHLATIGAAHPELMHAKVGE